MKLFKLKMTIIPVLAAAVMLTLFPAYSFAQDNEGGVNSGTFGLILQGGLDTGKTLYGDNNGSSSSSFGSGPGSGYDAGAMANLSIFAVKVQYTYSTFGTMKYTKTISSTEYKYETRGDGYYSTLDALLGLKLFTESGDMGYTYLYGGYRYWTAERNITSTYVNGTDAGITSKTELKGGGVICGFQDLSTLPLGFISLAIQSAVWIDSAPVKKVNGSSFNYPNKKALGLGFNLGVGVAFENIGLLVLAGYKIDVTATKYTSGSTDYAAGAGYGLAYISLAKEF